MRSFAFAITTIARCGAVVFGALASSQTLPAAVPTEPIAIGTTPQFFIDDYLVDNRWAIRYANASKEMVGRVLHPPKKFEGNPIFYPFKESDPHKVRQNAGYFGVSRDADTGLFRMWYQSSTPVKVRVKGQAWYNSVISYAESKDGISWTMPNLDLIQVPEVPDRNVVWVGVTGKAHSPMILDLPPEARRGFRYVMLYLDRGMKIMGSHDGIHWDRDSVTEIARIPSDTSNSIVYDAAQKEFVLFCRSKHIYGDGGDRLNVGEPRRIARMSSPELWTKWTSEPQNILQADETDMETTYEAFYGLTVQMYGGIYWGFLQPFRWNSEIECQLAFSRDGFDFQRLPGRKPLIDFGPAGSWESTMILASSGWIEVGDEWWIYYTGHDGSHEMPDRRTGIYRTGRFGLAKVRKEGFISMRGPENGGVIVTRKLLWPGGDLVVNADAHAGELKVRVSDANRKVVTGFDYADCKPFTADSISHQVSWGTKSMDQFSGQIVRIEFYLKKADIYTFRAQPKRN